jgi:hypothetical protein
VSLGFSASTGDPSAITTYVLRLFFGTYTLILATRSINQDNIEQHSESLWHLSSLTFLASALLFAIAILPAFADALYKTSAPLKSLGWTVLALQFVSFVIVSTIPQGPSLRFDPERIYSGKTIASTTNIARDNVCGVISTCNNVLIVQDAGQIK